MSPEQFVYWLHGYFELSDAAVYGRDTLDAPQVNMIKEHLAKVFNREIVRGKLCEANKMNMNNDIYTEEAINKAVKSYNASASMQVMHDPRIGPPVCAYMEPAHSC